MISVRRTKHRDFYKNIAVALVVLLFAGACGSKIPSERSSINELKVVEPWEIPTLDPLGSGSQFLRMQITETLVDARSDGTLLPCLASSWSVSAGGREWHFHLRSGTRFHDGNPLTAQAVILNLNRVRIEPGALSLASVSGMRAEGDDIVIELAQPSALLPALLAHGSTQILAPASFDAEGHVISVIGTGPYRVTALQQPQYFAATAFAQWRGPAPPARDVSYLSVSRSETRALMAESGQADLVFNLDPASLARLRSRSSLRVKSITIPRTVALKVNAGNSCFADVRTRQAISFALDRVRIARGILRDPEMAALQLLPPLLKDWYNPELPPLRTDRGEAVRLLQAAGWRRSNADALALHSECRTLELRAFPDRPELPLLASVVQEQLRQIGLTVHVNIGNSGDIPAGHHDGSLMMGLIARNYGMVPDPAGTLALDFCSGGGDWGAMNWKNREVPEALQSFSHTGDRAQAAALRRLVTRDLQDELPIIPIVWYRQTLVTSKRVVDIPMDPYERSYHLTEMQWTGKKK